MSKKYKDVPSSLFCGESGGTRKRSYPVNTPQRARAALAYAHKAPNPQGIRDCVYKISKQKGWLDEKGKLHMSATSSNKSTPKKKNTPKKRTPKKITTKKSTPKKKISSKTVLYKKEKFIVKQSPGKKNTYIIQKVKK